MELERIAALYKCPTKKLKTRIVQSLQVTSLIVQLPHGGLGADLPPGDRERLPAYQGRDGYAGQHSGGSNVSAEKGGIRRAVKGFGSPGKPPLACESNFAFLFVVIVAVGL